MAKFRTSRALPYNYLTLISLSGKRAKNALNQQFRACIAFAHI